MSRTAQFHDALSRLVQAGSSPGLRLVRLLEVVQANRYEASPIEFDSSGQTVCPEEETLTVTNLAEPADSLGQVPENTDAVALDVEGRWIVFLRPSRSTSYPARVISSQGSGEYSVREQIATGAGTFTDKSGASDVTAYNLAELSLGSGAAVELNSIVIVTVLMDNGDPPVGRYVFDHPVYAKYLD